MIPVRRTSVFAIALMAAVVPATTAAQNTPCGFDERNFSFKGNPAQQALCLLRPNGIGGVLSQPLDKLPEPLGRLVGRRVRVPKPALRGHLRALGISEGDVGGSIDAPLSTAGSSDGRRIGARYFVIHDTSHPYLGEAGFPDGFDDDRTWRGNDLGIWTRQPVAHVFVNRLGDSVTTTPFENPVAKGFGTKLARDLLKENGKGLKIHIELVQPRRRDPAHPDPKNDRIAPDPGFTRAQYERLALLYVVASVRGGSWLIPGYHSAFDAGIKGAHDDPQNFDLTSFATALSNLLAKLR